MPLALLAAFVLLSGRAHAQVPAVTWEKGSTGFDFLRADGGAEPDTTAPWRYFPLAVGNAWEYYYYDTGDRRRVDVIGEKVVNGRDYFWLRERTYDPDGEVIGVFGRPVRFDTLNAVVQVYLQETGQERPYTYGQCPLYADFGSEAFCLLAGGPMEVGGSYEGILAFGEELPGTGEDTVRTAVKTYYLQKGGILYDFRYAADIGFIFLEEYQRAQGLYYARVDGVEHGVAVYPYTVDAEPLPGEVERLVVKVYPNPSAGAVKVMLTLAEAGEAQVAVFDVLGREVAMLHDGPLAAGRHTLAFDAARLPVGLYVVQATGGGLAASQRFTVVR